MTRDALWRPSEALVRDSNLTRFATTNGFETGDYPALHRWSIQDRAAFWRAIWDFADVLASAPPSAVLRNGEKFRGSRWFDGARLNFAENLLRFDDDRTAIVAILETGERTALTYRELTARVARVARHLKTLGIGAGDRVAAWLPNTTSAIVAMLASTSLGAVWSSCSPDFGVDGALDRFGQIEPKLLIGCRSYTYNGRSFDTADKVLQAAAAVESIEHVLWDVDVETIGDHSGGDEAVSLSFTQRTFDDPLYILYSSGTTGKPKCIVHSAGGTLLQHIKEHQLHCNLSRADTLFFFTTTGWMMWNWLVSALATGCTVVLYDGSPFHPGPTALVDLIDREKISVFGVSAKYLSALEKAAVKPAATHDLTTLRSILSTGSPLSHETFRYVYRDFKNDVWLASMSGGTDIVSCFVLGNPWMAVHEGELQSKGLGMAVEVFDDAGRPVRGVKGELVCTKSFPSCPIGFWDDPDGRRFHEAYFDRFDNVWAHGDFAEITDHGGMIIHGRSDAVLNPGGVRIGTAEIYRQVENIDEIVDAVCVGQEWQDDVRVVLFVVLRDGRLLDDALTTRIKSAIRANATPRHVPAVILQVADVPKTMSGKIAELAVRETIHGRPVKNTAALANPECLTAFEAARRSLG